MKTWMTILTATLALSGSTNDASAGGFFQKLPKDGTYVKYYMEMKAEAGPMQEMTGTLTLKSVGTATEGGKKCRWIELEMSGEQNNRKVRTVIKMLVREKDLKTAKESVEVIRGWQSNKVGDMERQVKEFSEIDKSGNGPSAMFLGGKLKNAKTVQQKKTIDYQKGQLNIKEAKTGELEINMTEGAPAGLKYKMQRTIWSHQTVPTGVAGVQLLMEMSQKEKLVMKMRMNFNLQEFGTGAKSALPDKK